MLTAFGTSWTMIKASFKVLQSDKELIVFPIFSAIAMIGSVGALLAGLCMGSADSTK